MSLRVRCRLRAGHHAADQIVRQPSGHPLCLELHALGHERSPRWVRTPEPSGDRGKRSSQLYSPVPPVPERLASSRPRRTVMFAIPYAAALDDSAQAGPIMALTCDDMSSGGGI